MFAVRDIGLFATPGRAARMIAPALGVLCLMNVVPLLWSLGASFLRFPSDRPHTPPRFVGLGNYVYAILSEDVWERAQNTAVLMVASGLLQVAVGALLALLFHRPFPGRQMVMMLVLTPMLLSTVAVGTFFNLFYDPTFGFISAALRPLLGHPFVPLATPTSAMLSLIIADAWMWSPFVMLMLLAGLDSIPASLLETAQVDRLSGWHRFRAVIFPSIRGVLILAVLFRLIQSFNQFDLVYTITNGGPGTSTETIATETYGEAFVLFETGRASALANLGMFVMIVLVRLYFQALGQQDPAHREAWEVEEARPIERSSVPTLSPRAAFALIALAMPVAAGLFVVAPYLLRHYRVHPRLLVFPPAPGTAAAVEGWANLETVKAADADFPLRLEGVGRVDEGAALVAELDATGVPALRPGMAAEVSAPTLADQTFVARIAEVAAEPDADGWLRLRLDVTDPEGRLKQGMLAHFRLSDVPPAVTALAVPISAVVFENDGARVWVIDAEKVPAPRHVRIGRVADGKVEVLEGLQPGEQVVSRDALFLDRAWKGY